MDGWIGWHEFGYLHANQIQNMKHILLNKETPVDYSKIN
jgi:hypothetical protein